MRRLLVFAAFLLLLGLTSALAASSNVVAEDVTSFTTQVSISVPQPPLASGTYYVVGGPTAGQLVIAEPTSTGGNEKGIFTFQSTDITTEDRQPQPGDKVYYAAWTTGALADGLRFEADIVRVHFFRTSGTGTLTAGLFDCASGATQATVTPSCSLIGATGESASEQIDINAGTHTINPGRELRLKIVNLTNVTASIQWGYKAQNRPARIEVLP